MEKVKQFLEDFVKKEAEVISLKRTSDFQSYNKALQAYFHYFVDQMQGATGHMYIDEPDDEDILALFQGMPEPLPRHIFKISEYSNSTYGKVYAAFVSLDNPDENIKCLSSILLIIEEGDNFKIARFLLYTNYSHEKNGNETFRWHSMQGYKDLDLDSLIGPLKIERYVEPDVWQDGLKLYQANL